MPTPPFIPSDDSLFGPKTQGRRIHFTWSHERHSKDGAAHTQDKVLWSEEFESCIGLLLRNQRTGEVSGFHINDGLTRGHEAEFKRLRQTEDKFDAVLLTGKRGSGHMHDTIRNEYLRQQLPGTPITSLRIPFEIWDLAYDAASGRLHIGDAKNLTQVCDFGTPFTQRSQSLPNR